MPRGRSSLKAIVRGGIVLGAVVGMMQADAVFAYVQTGGVGTGQVAVAHTPLRVNQDTDMQPVGPGQRAQTLGGDFDNRNARAIHVGTVRASIGSVSKAPGAAAGTCDASDFTLADRTMTVGADVPSGAGTGAWTGATIEFNNRPGVDQNACQGATVKLRYTIS
jgi:hypothetical protein